MSQQSSRQISPPPFSRKEIQDRAFALSLQWARSVPLEEARLGLSFDLIYEEVIYPDFGIEIVEDVDLGHDAEGQKIFGEYQPIPNVAYIDRVLSRKMNDPRRAFTLWHEVGGHGVLQGNWLRRELERIKKLPRVVTTAASLSLSTTNLLEWQANHFAANAAAPSWFLWHVIEETYELSRKILYIGPGKYCLIVRGRKRYFDIDSVHHLCCMMALPIQFRFGWLSIEALAYRIEQLKIIDDRTGSQIDTFSLRRSEPISRKRFPAKRFANFSPLAG